MTADVYIVMLLHHPPMVQRLGFSLWLIFFFMRYKTLLFLLLFVIAGAEAAAQTSCPVIPLPLHSRKMDDTFRLDNHTMIAVKDPAFRQAAFYFRNQVLRFTGICLPDRNNGGGPRIVIKQSSDSGMRKGAYRLHMDAGQITIEAKESEGAFYGAVSLLQLIQHAATAAPAGREAGSVSLPCWNISDAPLYRWRGLLLDESRHFFGKKVVEEILDQMALLKLNRFHWHLTDEPGWRLQIRRYPRLTLIGGIGDHSDSLAPARYYTQQDIREIIRYAAERHIVIVPEIDMPGHATAANRAYPAYSGGGRGRYAGFTFNPGNEATYHYLTNILREVAVLFPAGMVHLGGDEVSFGSGSWSGDSGVLRLMKQEKLDDLTSVEHYFFRRMADSALTLFRKVLAWDEAADASLPPDSTVIFWWRQDKPQQLEKALKGGYEVVLCPRLPFYLDFVQDSRDRDGRRWGGRFNPLHSVYAFSAHIADSMHRGDQVDGVEGALWTETIGSRKRLEYLLFPRIAALAEAAWTVPARRNYAVFLGRLKDRLTWYRRQGIYYYDPFLPSRTPEVIDY